MARLLYRLGRLVAAHPVIVLLIWVAAAAGVTLVVKQVGSETSNNVDLPGTGSQLATDLLQAGFPPQQNGSNPIIFKVTKGKVTDSANKQAITDSYKAIKKIGFVHSATSPFSQDGQGQVSKDGKIAFISVLLSISSNELTEEEAQRVMNAAEPGVKAGMQVEGGGSIGSTLSPNDTSTSDLIGILAAMLILTLTFGTVVAMGMPIGGAVIGLTTALGLIGLMGHLIAVPDIAHTVATMIGLAVGIDYALFLVTRHRSQLAEGLELHESIARAVGTAGTAIVFAGCTVVVALVSLVVAGIPLVSSLGYTGAVAVGTAVLAAITLLPAFMSLAGKRINSIALPKRFQASDDPAHKGIWGRWAGFVVHRPIVPLLLAAAILVPLIIPVTDLHLGQEDIGQTPSSTMERRAYDLMQQGFGPGYNGPLIIAVALTPAAKADPAVTAQENQLKQLQNELDAEQKQGNEMQAQLETGQASLEKQQTQLEKQQAQLEAQQAQLNSEAAALAQQQAALEAEAASLQQQRDQLAAQAAALKARAIELAKLLVLNRAQQKRVEHAISISVNPARIARLEAKLARLQREEAAMVKEAKLIAKQAKALEAKAVTLSAQAAQLDQQKQSLEAQAADLQQQGAVLQQQADALKQQGNELQAQADELQAEKQQLIALQNKAKKQQKQATKLHNELVKTLTKAGGDDRGTDPRLVKLQDALTNTKGDKLVAPPQISKKGNDAVFTVIATTAPSAPATVDLVKRLRDNGHPQRHRQGDRRLRRRLDREQRRPGGRDLEPAAAGDHHDPAAQHAGAAGRVPLAADPAAGGGNQPADRAGRVRHRHRVLPVGLGHRHHRRRDHGRLGADRQLRAADDVRDPVRPEHGLPGVPALVRRPLPRGGRGRPQLRRRRPARRGARDRRRRADHDLGLLELHPERRPGGQAVRCRPVQRRVPGGDDGADARARGADPAGQVGLVDAALAGEDRAHHRHRGHGAGPAQVGAAGADVRGAGRGACAMMAAWPTSIPSRPPSGSAS